MNEPIQRRHPNLVEHHHPTPDAATDALAMAIVERLRTALHERAVASLVVSGGKSPIPLFERLAQADLDWSRVWITLVDERWVPFAHPDSNEGLVRRHLLQGPAAAARLVGLKSDHPSPADALADRTDALAAIPRPFDIVVLGMGEDGHTASLFPGTTGLDAALDPAGTAVLAAIDPPAYAPHPRISMTVAALLDARVVMLSIAGHAKRTVYQQARNSTESRQWPVGAVLNAVDARVAVFVG